MLLLCASHLWKNDYSNVKGMQYCPIYNTCWLQQDIDIICTWSTNNLLKFKCKYNSMQEKVIFPATPLTVDNQYQWNKFTHTGILVFCLASYLYSELVSAGWKCMSKSKVTKSHYLQIVLWPFKSILHTSDLMHVEYAVQVWDPHQWGQTSKTSFSNLEGVVSQGCHACITAKTSW